MSTSPNPDLPSGHLLVTPALTVKFSETTVTSYNMSKCEAEVDTIITWTLGKNSGNLKSFTLKAYSDVKDSEVRLIRHVCLHSPLLTKIDRFQLWNVTLDLPPTSWQSNKRRAVPIQPSSSKRKRALPSCLKASMLGRLSSTTPTPLSHRLLMANLRCCSSSCRMSY
jgi:hypothetical protein